MSAKLTGDKVVARKHAVSTVHVVRDPDHPGGGALRGVRLSDGAELAGITGGALRVGDDGKCELMLEIAGAFEVDERDMDPDEVAALRKRSRDIESRRIREAIAPTKKLIVPGGDS